MMIKKIFSLGMMSICIMLASCGKHPSESTQPNTIMTVESKAYSNTLYFNGYIQPLEVVPVTSAIAGVISAKLFQFGDKVNKHQLLYKVRPSTDKNSIQTALSTFLQSKEAVSTSKTQLQANELLHKNGLLSDNEYHSGIADFYNKELAFIQAENSLKDALKNYPDLDKAFALKLSDIHQVKELIDLMSEQKNIPIYAPEAGVALIASNNSGGGNNSESTGGSTVSGNAAVGSQINVGDLLVNIGNLTGIILKINVDEISIQNIKVGQMATVTNIAFPDLKMIGKVTSIAAEADSSSGAQPTFVVKITVASLTPTEKEELRIGMSANIAIKVDYPPKILIPISAVVTQQGSTFVNVIDPKTQKPLLKDVQTGQTTNDSVVILSGLNVGDKILVSH